MAENGIVIGNDFREGNVPPCSDNLEFLKLCHNQLPYDRRNAKLRADAASYQKVIVLNTVKVTIVECAIGGKND